MNDTIFWAIPSHEILLLAKGFSFQPMYESFNSMHLIKLLLAAVAGIMIGFEREIREKPVGTKTMLILTVGSCLLTIVSIEGARLLGTGQYDPLRLASSIIQGIGFLGGGIILKQSNSVIVGITTATMVWVAGGIGVAIGAGFYIETAITVILMIVSVELLPFFIKRIGPESVRQKQLILELTIPISTSPSVITSFLQEKELTVTRIKIKENTDNLLLTYTLRAHRTRTTSSIYQEIKTNSHCHNINIEMID